MIGVEDAMAFLTEEDLVQAALAQRLIDDQPTTPTRPARNTSSPPATSDTNSESESDEDDEPAASPSPTPLLFTDEDNEPAASPTPTPTPFPLRNSATPSKKVPLDWLRDELENENDEDDRPAPIKTKRDGTPMKRKDSAMIRDEERLPANIDKVVAKIEAKGGTFIQGGHIVFVTLFKAVEFNRLHNDLSEQSRELKALRAKAEEDELKLKTLQDENDKLQQQVATRAIIQKRKATPTTTASTPAKRQKKLVSAFDNLDELVETAIETIYAKGDPTNEKIKGFVNRAENRIIYDFI
ncbi:hypothetical protein PZA11_007999 [Diplocarpon coronariae]